MREELKHTLKCFKKHTITGIIILLPVMGTLWFLSLIYNFFADINVEFIENRLGIRIPGFQIVLVILVVFLVGMIVNTSLGATLLRYSEKAISQLPFIKGVYGGIKQLTNTFSSRSEQNQTRVVLVEYPRKGIWQLGFVTSDAWEDIRNKSGKNLINVIMPTTPNPTGGMLILIPSEDIVPIEMTYNEGMKYVVSGGIVAPHADQDNSSQSSPSVPLNPCKDEKKL
jgi:uncharacterized membrane protein